MTILFLPTIVLAICNLLLFLSQISCASDTITHSETFTDNNTLVSKNGTFELGFFNPGNSSNRYIGIWYKNIPVRRVVWVANRDNPIKDNSSKLIINEEGNLVLLNQNQTLIWSTNATKKASNPIVQLLDNGNLVLRDEKENNNEESYLWQSFDYLGDTLLPGMKIGFNKRTGLNRRNVAWKNWDDPSSGDFTSSMELNSNPEMVIWKGSVEYYRAGPYVLKVNPLYNYEFVNNEDELYYMFTLKNSSLISIIVLNQTLSLRQRLTWVPNSGTWTIYQSFPQDNCDFYNVCGANGNCLIDGSPMCHCLDGFEPKSAQQWNALEWTQGCVRSGNWSCQNKDRDGFRKLVGMKLPDTTHSWINEKMTLDDCQGNCLKNCSCTAYSSLNSSGVGSGCSMWFGDLLDLRVSQSGQDLYVRIDTYDMTVNAGDKHGEKKKTILVVSITFAVAFIIILAFFYIYITKGNFKANFASTRGKDKDNHEGFEIPFFDLHTILKATDKYSICNKLGEGGFGAVYKGTLLDGQEIAVKRLSRSSGQGLKEFKNEVILCAKLQHRNLVKVISCCFEGEEKMIIYEYMPNKSLDTFLFDSSQSSLLDWSMRFNILCGIARGLLYLHQDSRLRIIHRDLKVSNILLDIDMNPKISDFGLARMCGNDQVDGRTSRIVGTFGYMAPEYVKAGLFSTKSDVFSLCIITRNNYRKEKQSPYLP